MFHFKLRHIAGKTFGPDGLSRRDKQVGDKEYPPDKDLEEINKPPELITEEGMPLPLDFEEFKHKIDTQGGYLQGLVTTVEDFEEEAAKARKQYSRELEVRKAHQKGMTMAMDQFTNQFLLPADGKNELDLEYPEDQ